MKVHFLGATGTVTGSKYLVEAGDKRILIDCGIYQGIKQLRLRNWKRPPIDLEALDAIILTHAHIDHSGYLPALVRDGFAGPIYCTPPTRALCEILLPDSARLHEEDAAYANRKGFSRHHPALPLYTEADARAALSHLTPLAFRERLSLGDVEIAIQPAGHILGAGSVQVFGANGSILFSGDLGREDDLIMFGPEPPGALAADPAGRAAPHAAPDWIVVESTYGDRLHPKTDPVAALAEVLCRTLDRGGTLLIPTFAVARAQSLLAALTAAFERGLAPRVPVYLNSPMACSVTELYQQFDAYHKLSSERCDTICDLPQFVRTVDDSKALCARGSFGGVILSASGMLTGGRVLHHLAALAPDRRNTILLAGFQAPGTRGQALADGTKELKVHGRYVPVEAEVAQLHVLSAHADRDGLLRWVAAAPRVPREIFVTHGEPLASDVLRRHLADASTAKVTVPEYGDVATLR